MSSIHKRAQSKLCQRSTGRHLLGKWLSLYWLGTFMVLPIRDPDLQTEPRGVTVQTGLLYISSFFATFVNSIGLENVRWNYYVAYVVYTLLERRNMLTGKGVHTDIETIVRSPDARSDKEQEEASINITSKV
ncbi:hypothetical protein TSTA_106520 [Talaromyces stipitatus ATCC 10500]|uniref:Uncharacterized protein n=1 Tax=Talaromyces stipitatus (strain ATCC 10500 / CBS 375.48 / QM 6759 / NRRL 1006) TaxID=441959 RepID=B8MPK3_TALSN|nr:uncharacterized protein TSTA_106520 [Talaromyces stipitatus ATCC 10500]EED14442.1 hypothetical protein TSTA_106520 [Talaromyces stipitatus ATCC 10500]